MESIKSLLYSREAQIEAEGQTDRPKEFSCPSIVTYTETECGDTELTFSDKKYIKDLDDLQTELIKLKLRRGKEQDIVQEFIGPELALFSRECEVRNVLECSLLSPLSSGPGGDLQTLPDQARRDPPPCPDLAG